MPLLFLSSMTLAPPAGWCWVLLQIFCVRRGGVSLEFCVRSERDKINIISGNKNSVHNGRPAACDTSNRFSFENLHEQVTFANETFSKLLL